MSPPVALPVSRRKSASTTSLGSGIPRTRARSTRHSASPFLRNSRVPPASTCSRSRIIPATGPSETGRFRASTRACSSRSSRPSSASTESSPPGSAREVSALTMPATSAAVSTTESLPPRASESIRRSAATAPPGSDRPRDGGASGSSVQA